MKEPNEIDLLFQDGLNGLAFTPDPYVKENIDHAIASKKKRRRFLFILFPVFLSLTGIAAIGFFYQNQNQNRNQDEIRRRSRATDLYVSSSDNLVLNDHHSQTNSEANVQIKRNHFQTKKSSNDVQSTYRQKSKVAISASEKPIPFDNPMNPETKFDINRQEIQAEYSSEKTTDRIPAEQETLAATENKQDSLRAMYPDSTAIVVSEAFALMGPNKGTGKWSLSLVTYWEGEKKRKNDFSKLPFVNYQGETARIHASTFYAKFEIGYKLNTDLEFLSGIGFRTSKVVQYGYLSKIEIPLEGTSSGVPQPIYPAQPDTIHRSEKQSFRVNSIVLPIGLAYTFQITTRLSLRIAGGGEFAYGKITSRFVHPALSAPKFTPFGCSVWLRPELHYSFGRTQLFGFGTFNQSLSQQLKWNFDSRRNPAFGAGIGLRIQL